METINPTRVDMVNTVLRQQTPTDSYCFHHLKWFELSWFGDNPGCLGGFPNPNLPIWRECQSFILLAQAIHFLFQGISSGNITQEFGKLQNHLKIFLHVCWSGFHGKKTTSHRVFMGFRVVTDLLFGYIEKRIGWTSTKCIKTACNS